MSYVIVSGESPRNVLVDVVETEAEIADAVARAVYGTTADALAEPIAHRDMVAELIENEELRFEDGFVRLYRGGLRQPPKSGTENRWRHVKRGTAYTELGVGALQTATPIEDGERLMFYRGEDGQLWARPFIEFMDGRFERIEPPKPVHGPVVAFGAQHCGDPLCEWCCPDDLIVRPSENSKIG